MQPLLYCNGHHPSQKCEGLHSTKTEVVPIIQFPSRERDGFVINATAKIPQVIVFSGVIISFGSSIKAPKAAAAEAAAAWMSPGDMEAGTGKEEAEFGKLSPAIAAISGVENVPNQIRLGFLGSRISETHLSEFFRCLTPLYKGWRPLFSLEVPGFCGEMGDEFDEGEEIFEGILWQETLCKKSEDE
ncbi:hypothetical protein HID58_058931 [Brassica napus]|uniref:Uncharacterized protein n=1 Tax=Brassica napus TaxID=3708 RepID=A0ABQ7ZS73_BRANA|nr:hypothetical protein HID58_058931 [Brassica napus]